MKKWNLLSDKNTFESEEDVISELLKIRKITKSIREEFFSPDIRKLTLRSVGIDEKEFLKFSKRMHTAIKSNEEVVIFGDYDVDGICASAILWETLYTKSKNIKPYIPSRIEEGYGLSIKGIDKVVTQYPELKLIITVDNGIVANDAVEYANTKGIDVIITDHHAKGTITPNAFCTIHTTELCGAGIAWLLAKELGWLGEEVYEKLELASLATIADLVPLNKWNRAIVVHGLKILRRTKRPGLIELLAGANLEKQNIDVYAIGHVIGPRLNASGRITHAIDSLRLICTNDFQKAKILASTLQHTNKDRQTMTEEAVLHASLSVEGNTDGKKVLVVSDASYAQGVIGLIASKLVEKYYIPSIAISISDDVSKGSARSINGVNIIELLRSVSDTLMEAGGHPMAAGFSIKTKDIKKFEKAISQKADAFDNEIFERKLSIDLPLDFSLMSFSLCEKISLLSPFGMGNREPLFLSENVTVEEVKLIGSDKRHLKLKLHQGKGKILDAVGFGMAENMPLVRGDILDIVYTFDKNVWNGRESLQLKLRDFKKISD